VGTKALISVIVAVGFFFYNSLSVAATCEDLEGFYNKRVELLSRYQIDHQEGGVRIAKIKEMDSLYATVIDEIVDSRSDKVYKECCDHNRNDNYLLFVCKLATYLREGKSSIFLSNIPATKDRLRDLWELDKITSGHLYRSRPPNPQLLSFVDLFLYTVYQLSTESNKTALALLLILNSSADGEYAEYTQGLILSLFEKQPSVLLKNWNLVREHASSISFETTDYRDRAEAIIRNIKRTCEQVKHDPKLCEEAVRFLEARK
jgi:hypothetical protein